MFTPPPSPIPLFMRQAAPTQGGAHASDVSVLEHQALQDTPVSHSKQRFRRSILWTVVLVPLALITIATMTRSVAHPAALDLLSASGAHKWSWAQVADWSFHERHIEKPFSRSLVGRDTSTIAPTVPVNPMLPTPFPQPFDTTLSANFSDNACYNFFLNMTQSQAFRACRPFSLLITTSHAFEEAQNDINEMNTDVWGTCNTDISQSQCDMNMAWFASELQATCQTDIANKVSMAVDTLTALHAYDLMRNAACQVDPATNAYCYVEAVAASDPSSYWFYQLPLGQPLVPITNSACNDCTKSLMAMYASALNGTNSTSAGALSQTYSAAADNLNNVCGSTYAKVVNVATSSALANVNIPASTALLAVLLFAGVSVWS